MPQLSNLDKNVSNLKIRVYKIKTQIAFIRVYKTGISGHKINISASNLLFIVILIWVTVAESLVSESVDKEQ